MQISDSIQLSDFQTTPEGFLVTKARFSRTGILTYLVGDAGLRSAFPDRKLTDQVRIYRPPEEVFSKESLDSIAGKPITIDHPGEFVNSKNAPALVVGVVGDSVSPDGEFTSGIVRIMHEDGVEAVRSGKKELSVGYNLDLDVTAGVTPEGEAYDAIQRMIRANHVALVDKGRCGPSCRLHDGAEHETNCRCAAGDQNMKMIDHNGVSIEVSDQAADAFSALQASHSKTLSAKDAEIENFKKKSDDDDEKVAKAEAKADDSAKKLKDAEDKLTPEALDTAAKDRTKLLEDAKKIAPDLDCSAMDSKAIKIESLKAIDVDTTDKSEAFIDASFDARVDVAGSVGGESTRAGKQLANASANDANGNPTDSRQAFIDSMTSATRKKES